MVIKTDAVKPLAAVRFSQNSYNKWEAKPINLVLDVPRLDVQYAAGMQTGSVSAGFLLDSPDYIKSVQVQGL